RSQKSEVRSQKSEVRSQKSEVRSQKSEVRSQKSEVRSQKSEVKLLRLLRFETFVMSAPALATAISTRSTPVSVPLIP
ncbi:MULTISPECIES: hypothetical protein, partial [unclassified Moorena]|uniref:hypothetical protein n=1 Tax=unclassified Moorena TaxID=2683338 RepID=UPI0013C6B071